jgi:purine-binding chemotaxis protein CheW
MNPKLAREPTKSLVGFLVDGVQYALPVELVREVTNPVPTVLLPHAPSAVVGVMDYRGAIVTVVDLRVRFGLQKREPTRKTKWIVVDLSGRTLALVVDAVTEVFGTTRDALRMAPWLGGGDALGVAGVANRGGLVFLLDVAALRELAEPSSPSIETRGKPSHALPEGSP